jgi:DNA polymerase-3 subunit beta
MNVTVNTTALAQELRLLNHVVPSKPPLPVLMNVLVRADMEGLHFYATDLEIGFSTTCRATITEPGTITLPAKRLLDLIEQLPDADVNIVLEKGHVRVMSGAFKSRLQTLDAEHFPGVPTPSGDVSTLITARLQAMITRIRYAITDKTKFMVNGALLTLNEQLTALVATDGKRLSLATTAKSDGAAASVVVPAKTLDALLALFTEETIAFSHVGPHLFFVSNDRMLVSRTLEGEFPKYERIIPRNNDKKATIDRASLSAALRRVGLLADTTNYAVVLAFEPNALIITSSSVDAGDALERVSIAYDGPPIKLCVSWRFVLDFLDVATSPSIVLDFKEATTPLMLTDGTNFINVVIVMKQ